MGRITLLLYSGDSEIHRVSLKYINVSFEELYFIAIRCTNSKNMVGPVSNVGIFLFSIHQNNAPYEVTTPSSLPPWAWIIIAISIFLFILIPCTGFLIAKQRKRNKDSIEGNGDARTDDGMGEAGMSYIETNEECQVPDIISEIQMVKSGLKRKNRYYKKVDGSFTVSKQSASILSSGIQNGEPETNAQKCSSFNEILSSRKYKQKAQRSVLPQVINAQWVAPDEPLQNHAYSNPLFGESGTVLELELRNSVITDRK